MNRRQRRQQNRRDREKCDFMEYARVCMKTEAQPDFSEVPNGILCHSIMLLINELRDRGYPVYDFDHKNKSLQQIQIIGNRVYFLAAPEEGDADEAEAKEADAGV